MSLVLFFLDLKKKNHVRWDPCIAFVVDSYFVAPPGLKCFKEKN
jgi:hypothetical protein